MSKVRGTDTLCGCGRKSFKYYNGSPVCKTCFKIESSTLYKNLCMCHKDKLAQKELENAQYDTL